MIHPHAKVYPTYWLNQAKYYSRLREKYYGLSSLEFRIWECLFNHYWEEDDE